MVELYNGPSEGFRHVVKGYVEYGKEVVINRAIPALEDGLKPVNRRILYIGRENKSLQKDKTEKSATWVGLVQPIHPHGDAAIYDALVRMTDKNGSFPVPMIEGQGNLGTFTSKAGPAAMRYTEIRVGKYAWDYFGYGMDGIGWKDREAGEGVEPVVLPVKYPALLVNGSSGLAVSMSTLVPSFNFWDVLDLLEKFVTTKTLDENDMIYPDFVTGGHYIEDRAEAMRLMKSGNGIIKVRADVDIKGSDIIVNELPVGLTIEAILTKITNAQEKGDLRNVKSARNDTGFSNSSVLVITCRNKNVVEDVLIDLYRRRILQNTISANMNSILDGKSIFKGGVFEMVKVWVEWRKGVLAKQLNLDLESARADMEKYSYFIDLVSDDTKKSEFLRLLTKVSRQDAISYLKSLYEGIVPEICDWIADRSASAFLNGGTYKSRYDALRERITGHESDLANLDSVILRDIKELRSSHAGDHERRTQITTKDYRFSKSVTQVAEDYAPNMSPCVYTIYKDGFLKKTSYEIAGSREDSSVLNIIHSTVSGALLGFDNAGRVLKVWGDDIPLTTAGTGTYIFNYVGDSFDSGVSELQRLLYMGALDGSTKMLLFTDGKVSFLDTSKWANAKARHKVVNGGVNEAVFDKLLDVIEEENFPEALLVADASKGDRYRFSVVPMSEIRKPKTASGMAKVFQGSGGVHLIYWGDLGAENVDSWIATGDSSRFRGRLNSMPGNPSDPNTAVSEGIDLLEILNEPRYSSVPLED